MSDMPKHWLPLIENVRGPLFGYHHMLVSSGGYQLLTLTGETVMLNLDHAILVDNGLMRDMRQQVLVNADKHGIDILPVSYTAYHATMRSFFRRHHASWPPTRDAEASTLGFVYRNGLEGVFTLGDEYYLTGYDDQESPPLYFLCRLPHAVKTVEEARDALMPESVRQAHKAGLQVRRQGDLFVARSFSKRRDLTRAKAKFYKLNDHVGIYGTAHTATEMAVLPDGRTLVTGAMYHDPRGILNEPRRPDHQPLRLDRGWWWVCRNTVPVGGPVEPREPDIELPGPPEDWLPEDTDALARRLSDASVAVIDAMDRLRRTIFGV